MDAKKFRDMNPVNPGKDFSKPPNTKYPLPSKTPTFRDMNPVNPGKDFSKPPRRLYKPIYPVPTIWYDRYRKPYNKKRKQQSNNLWDFF